jgi:hypothetical protein
VNVVDPAGLEPATERSCISEGTHNLRDSEPTTFLPHSGPGSAIALLHAGIKLSLQSLRDHLAVLAPGR